MKIHKSNDRRNKQYAALKKAGFNSYEATRYKDFSNKKIELLIQDRKAYNKAQKQIVSGART